MAPLEFENTSMRGTEMFTSCKFVHGTTGGRRNPVPEEKK